MKTKLKKKQKNYMGGFGADASGGGRHGMWGPRPSRSATSPPAPPPEPHIPWLPPPEASAPKPPMFFVLPSVFFYSSSYFIYWMVERRNPPNAIHFTIENENAIASKLGGPPTPPASIIFSILYNIEFLPGWTEFLMCYNKLFGSLYGWCDDPFINV